MLPAAMMPNASALPAASPVVTRTRLLIGISVFWLALSFLFDGLTVLVLPSTVALLVPEGTQATILGVITFVGLIAAMLVQPLVGMASDRVRGRWGRRGVLALGVLGVLGGLTVFGVTALPATVALGYIVVQLAGSSAQAAQQGFIPDQVPPAWRGRAAGVKGAMDVGGAFLAFLILGSLLEQGGASSALLAVGAVVVGAFVLTVLLVHERDVGVGYGHRGTGHRDGGQRVNGPSPMRQARTPWSSVTAPYRVDRRRYPPFVWLVVSRFLFLLGTYAIGRFFLFFMAERLALEPRAVALEAGWLLATLTGITAVAAVPAGLGADRFGRRPLMVAGAAVSAAGAVLLIAASDAAHILVFGGLLSLGSAAFASANWAATTEVIPAAEAGRYLAIANFGTAGAAAAAGLAGPLIDLMNAVRPGAGYPTLFTLTAVAFLGSALATRRVTLASAASEW